jgi:predicted DNA-binding protein with PD1-like motif
MQAKKLGSDGEQLYALIFEAGDEVVAELEAFARSHRLRAAHFQAIGAFSDAVLGYYQWERKAYKRIPVDEQVEVVSLSGDLALEGGEPSVHAHVVVARADGSTVGGHLLRAHVRPTLELVCSISPRHLQRQVDAATGLPLIDPLL